MNEYYDEVRQRSLEVRTSRKKPRTKYNDTEVEHGKVVTYSMYDEIISFEILTSLSRKERWAYLSHWRDKYGTAHIAKVWGVEPKKVRNLIGNLKKSMIGRGELKEDGVVQNTDKKSVKKTETPDVREDNKSILEVIRADNERMSRLLVDAVNTMKALQQSSINSSAESFVKVDPNINGDTLSDYFMKLADFVKGENLRFKVNIIVERLSD